MAAAAGSTEDGLLILGQKQSTTTRKKTTAGEVCMILVFLVLLVLGVVYLITGVVYFFGHWQRWFGPYDPVEYTVTIAAVSGLDPAKDLQGPAAPLLDPAFNLNLHVASPLTAKGRECVKQGTTVEVSYPRSGVPLATGPVPAFCVEVGERREEGSIVAWGQGVRLPGFVLDSLAADMLHGAPEFGVKLTPPLPWFLSSTVDVISCSAKVGGGGPAPSPCIVSRETVSFPPVPHPGVRDSAAAYLSPPNAGERSEANSAGTISLYLCLFSVICMYLIVSLSLFCYLHVLDRVTVVWIVGSAARLGEIHCLVPCI